jgi:hypothetical protein
MNEFHRNTGFDGPMVVCWTKLSSEKGKKWPKSFAPGQQQVLCNLGQIWVIRD